VIVPSLNEENLSTCFGEFSGTRRPNRAGADHDHIEGLRHVRVGETF
jgi:hypothetical protein